MKLKDRDLKILSELMKNAKISDRELAGRLGVSQPTVTRRRARLEKERIIKEYTFLPDFSKLEYHIMAITLIKYNVDAAVDRERRLEAREKAMEIVKQSPFEMVMAEHGMGIGYDGVTISFHKDYNAYVEFKRWIRQSLPLKATKMDSFLVSQDDKFRYKPLTFSTLAKHLLTLRDE